MVVPASLLFIFIFIFIGTLVIIVNVALYSHEFILGQLYWVQVHMVYGLIRFPDYIAIFIKYVRI